MYSVNLYKILSRLLPAFLRGGSFHFLVLVGFMELETLKASFDTLRTSIDYRLKFTSQVVYLTKYLNELYDPSLERIEIQDGTISINYIYSIAEAPVDPLAIFGMKEPEITARVGKIGEILGRYVVEVPDALMSTVTANQAIYKKIDFFNPAGVGYLVRSDAFVDSFLAIGAGYSAASPLYSTS